MAFPGSEDIYVYTSDVFPLPVKAEHLLEAKELLETIASPQAQLIFSKEKGSIPARTDVLHPDDVDRKRQEDFRVLNTALATSGFFPPYYRPDDLNDKLRALIQAPLGTKEGSAAIEDVVDELVALQPVLARWQKRLREGPLDSPMP